MGIAAPEDARERRDHRAAAVRRMLLLMAIRVPIAMAMMVPGVSATSLFTGWPSLLNALKVSPMRGSPNYD